MVWTEREAPLARLTRRGRGDRSFSALQRLLFVVNRAAGTTVDGSLESSLTVLRSGADLTVAATAYAD